MTTAQEVYEKIVQPLPLPERVRLASLILEQLSREPQIDPRLDPSYSDEWTKEDIEDLRKASIQHAFDTILKDEEDRVA